MPRTKPRPLKPSASPNAEPNGIGETPEVLTLEEAASYFRVPADAVLPMIDAERLPARRFGADWLLQGCVPGSVGSSATQERYP